MEKFLAKLVDGVKVLLDMIFDWKLWLALVGLLTAFQAQSPELILAAVGVYLGAKTYIDAGKTAVQPAGEDYTHEWTGISKIDSFLSKVLFSTRAWVAVVGMFLVRELGDMTMFQVILYTWMGTLGIGEGTITMLKQVDLSFLGKKAKQPAANTSVVVQPQPYVAPTQESKTFTPTTDWNRNPLPEKVQPTKPAYMEFDAGEWEAKIKKVDKVAFTVLSAIPEAARREVAYYVQNVKDFAFWFTNKAYEEFRLKFGFDYNDIGKHFNDAGGGKLLKCPVTSIISFKEAMPQDYKILMEEVEDVIWDVSNFFTQLNRVGVDRMDNILLNQQWTYDQVFYHIDNLK